MFFGSASQVVAGSFPLSAVLGGPCPLHATSVFAAPLSLLVALAVVLCFLFFFVFSGEVAIVDAALAIHVTVTAGAAIGGNVTTEYRRLPLPMQGRKWCK